jgi:hypothetical protein
VASASVGAARAPETTAARDRSRTSALIGAVLVLLTALAVWLRVPALGPSSLWLDDAWQALTARTDDPLVTGLTAPGWSALLDAVLAVFGPTSTLAAQALPFTFGVIAVPLAFAAARILRLAPGPALVAATVLAVSPMAVAMSTRVKPYTADIALSLVVLAVGWVVSQRATRRAGLVLAATSAGAVVVSAAVLTSVVGAWAVVLLAAWRRGTVRFAARPAVALAAFLGVWWLLVLRPATTPALRDYWSAQFPDDAQQLGQLLLDAVRGLAPLPAPLTAAVLVLAAVVVAVRRPVLLLLLTTPTVVAVVAACLHLAPLGGERTDVHLYASWALLVAAAADVVGRRIALRRLLAAAVVVALLGVGLAHPAVTYPSEDVRPLVSVLEAERQPDDAVLVYSATRWAYALYTDEPVRLVADGTSPNGFDVRIDAAAVLEPHRDDPGAYRDPVGAAAAGSERVWVLASHIAPDLAGVHAALAGLGYQPARTDGRPGAELSLWVRPG